MIIIICRLKQSQEAVDKQSSSTNYYLMYFQLILIDVDQLKIPHADSTLPLYNERITFQKFIQYRKVHFHCFCVRGAKLVNRQ